MCKEKFDIFKLLENFKITWPLQKAYFPEIPFIYNTTCISNAQMISVSIAMNWNFTNYKLKK